MCLVTQLCLTLCNPLDCSPPGSSVHGISQARIRGWVAFSWPRDQTHISCVSCIAGGLLSHWERSSGTTKGLNCWSTVDVGRRHEIPGSETKDFIIHSTAGSLCFMFVPITLDLESSSKMTWKWIQVAALHVVDLHHSWGIPITSSGCPAFAPYSPGQPTNLLSALLSLSFIAVGYTNILIKIDRNKSW